MIEQSFVSLLLTAQYWPFGEQAIQLGHLPTWMMGEVCRVGKS